MARESGIELPEKALKAQIVAALEESGDNVITVNTVKPSGTPTNGVRPVSDGVIGSAAPERPKKPRVDEPVVSNDKVALYASKNLHWTGVGHLKHGYNFVSEEAAGKWLRHKAVRAATPEEVASHYDV